MRVVGAATFPLGGPDEDAQGLVKRRISVRPKLPLRRCRAVVYERDVVLQRQLSQSELRSRKGGGRRGKISGLSNAAWRRFILALRNGPHLTYRLTLTYPAQFPTDGKIVSDHTKRMRRSLVERGVSGIWYLEFQTRGAAHIHMLLDRRVDKEWVSARWARIVGDVDANHARVGTAVERIRDQKRAFAYALKRVSKTVPSGFTDPGRLWGCFGKAKTKPVMVIDDHHKATKITRVLRSVVAARCRSGKQRRRAAG